MSQKNPALWRWAGMMIIFNSRLAAWYGIEALGSLTAPFKYFMK